MATVPDTSLRAPIVIKLDDEKTDRVVRELTAKLKELQDFVRQLIEAS